MSDQKPNPSDPEALFEILERFKGSEDTLGQDHKPNRPIDKRPTASRFAQPVHEFLKSGPAAVEWLVDQLIPRAGLVLLAARPKAGKSLFTLNLALGLQRGRFLGRKCAPIKTLIVQLEDMSALVRERILRMGPEEGVFVRADRGLDNQSLVELEQYIKAENIGLVVIDPLIFAAGGIDENDAAKMGQFLLKLRKLIFRTKATILLVHHHRKSNGSNGEAIRGSSAILGAVDVALELKRENENTPRATLSATTRLGHVEPESLRLDKETLTWHSEGSAQDYKQTKREREILEALGDSDQEMDCPTLESAMGLKTPNFMPAIKRLVAKDLVIERKERTRGRPRSYFCLAPASNQAES